MKKAIIPSIICCLIKCGAMLAASSDNLVENPGFEQSSGRRPAGYVVQGPVEWKKVGGEDEYASNGMVIAGTARENVEVSQVVKIDPKNGKWLTFTFRGRAEDGFALEDDSLTMKMEFFSQNGTHHLEEATRLIAREIEEERRVLAINGNHGRGGAAVWRTYGFEELVPFDEVDAVKVSLIYKAGAVAAQRNAAFSFDAFSVEQSKASPTGRLDPATRSAVSSVSTPSDESKLIALGGRWYYEPLADEKVDKGNLVVTENNADRLYYKAGGWTTPFSHNMTAWLRAGYLDRNGDEVTKDRPVANSVTVIFKGDGFLTVRARNLPNHPTAKFPDTIGTQGYNPNHIQELDKTYRLPLDPVLDPKAKATDKQNLNHALPMGSIGVAVNGVVFYNPFDAGNMDASSIMDRCCGHPSQDNRYHYHKYPICVNTSFVDKGQAHSGLIGFAFDGLPLYGPYESAGVMARDSTTNPLNDFNAHYDKERGWHYHVSPGKFPYLIGGYFAKVEKSNLESRPMRPPGGGPMPGEGGGPPPPNRG